MYCSHSEWAELSFQKTVNPYGNNYCLKRMQILNWHKKSNESEINPENSGKHAMHYEKFR